MNQRLANRKGTNISNSEENNIHSSSSPKRSRHNGQQASEWGAVCSPKGQQGSALGVQTHAAGDAEMEA